MNRWNTFRTIRIVRVLFVCMLLILFIRWNPRALFSPVYTVMTVLSEPFATFFSFAGYYAGDARDFAVSISSLKKENEQLHQDVTLLRAENARLTEVQYENDSLRRNLNLLPREDFRLEAAEIIGRDSRSDGNWALINKGSESGVKEGMMVIVYQSVVVGRIIETSSGTSKVLLLTSPESMINGIDAQTEARGVAQGQFGVGLVMHTVSQSDLLREGDSIVTSGLEGNIPRGLLLGTIDTVSASPDKLFQQATLQTIFSIEKEKTVFVIIGRN